MSVTDIQTVNWHLGTKFHALQKLAHAIKRFFLALKIAIFQLKILDIFSYICSKHRFGVHVRTSVGQSV